MVRFSTCRRRRVPRGEGQVLRDCCVHYSSLDTCAGKLLDLLDPHDTIHHRLYSQYCVQQNGNFVKDLSLLNRDLTQPIIVDDSPVSYAFHDLNAIGCSSFIGDMNDHELYSIAEVLVDSRAVGDVRDHMGTWDASYSVRTPPHI